MPVSSLPPAGCVLCFDDEALLPGQAASTAGMAAKGEALDPLIKPVLEFVSKAGSYNEILEKLYGLYPNLDGNRMQELINQAMFAADLWGYVQSRENKF